MATWFLSPVESRNICGMRRKDTLNRTIYNPGLGVFDSGATHETTDLPKSVDIDVSFSNNSCRMGGQW